MAITYSRRTYFLICLESSQIILPFDNRCLEVPSRVHCAIANQNPEQIDYSSEPCGQYGNNFHFSSFVNNFPMCNVPCTYIIYTIVAKKRCAVVQLTFVQ